MTAEGRVAGIGGVFWRADDPEALSDWYARHLGVSLNAPIPQEAGVAIPAAFRSDTDYWPRDRSFMLNFRVVDLDALVARLGAAGIAVERRADWDTAETGRFARITDPEGTPIELWEPPGAPG